MVRAAKKGRNLVGNTAEALRDLVFAAEPGERIGSLQDLTRSLNVGIVTLQQAVRVLEHEGLLEVRRGPGGGYYGMRPDAAAIERAVSVFLRTHPASFGEALNITSLLFIELVGAAANCQDPALRNEMTALGARIEMCNDPSDRGNFEYDLQSLLFRMVKWPLFELLTHVTLSFAVSSGDLLLDWGEDWKIGRKRIIAAILSGDPELARFEAERSNRRPLLRRLH